MSHPFLTGLLMAQGESLKILRTLIVPEVGEPQFLAALDKLDQDLIHQDDVRPIAVVPKVRLLIDLVDLNPLDLESALQLIGLPETLHHYCWAFPLYRACIEPLNPHSCRVEDALDYSQQWVRGLLDRVLGLDRQKSRVIAEQAHQPWLRFRATQLQKSRLKAVV